MVEFVVLELTLSDGDGWKVIISFKTSFLTIRPQIILAKHSGKKYDS
jgi:hypothetical protein